jgi:hypothetical protein
MRVKARPEADDAFEWLPWVDFCQSGATQCAGQIRCKRLVKSNANEWASAMQMGGQVECNYQSNTEPLRIIF